MTKQQEIERLEAALKHATSKQENWIDFPDLNEKGRPMATLVNTQLLLDHYGIGVRYNEMKKEPEIAIPGKHFHGDTKNNVQITWIEDLARQYGMSTTEISKQLDLFANANAFHPVRDWIAGQVWDGVSRLESYYSTVNTTSPMKELFMRKWALSVVAACFRNDYRFGAEGVLVFLGSQAAAKTSWVERLFPRVAVTDSWITTGCTIDPHNKDTLLIALSSLITEMGEIGTTFKRSEKESLKQFLTQKKDRLRPPYAAKVNDYSRRTVFYGTSNELMILNDTQNRRYWPLPDVSFPDVKFDVAQFWAEIYEMYKAVLPLCDTRSDSMVSGEWGWFLSPDERAQLQIEQEDMRTINPIIEALEDTIESAADCNSGGATVEWENATAICKRAGILNPNKLNANEAAEWLKSQGYRYRKDTKKYGVVFKHDPDQYIAPEKSYSTVLAGVRSKVRIG